MKRWKRFLFLFHRWVGIVLCAIFVLWFVSGIFMMYVEFPQLTQPERIAGETKLNFGAATLTPSEAVARLTRGDFSTRGTPSRNEELAVENAQAAIDTPKSIQLTMVMNRPAYVVNVQDSQPRLVFADTGEVLRDVRPDMALSAARIFAGNAGVDASRARFDGTVQTDQWTISSALDGHRPLLRVALNDDLGTDLYVSSRTGQVVRDSHTQERVLNYFAAVTHWLYPTFIRKFPDGWAWMVDILSGVGALFAVTGLWIGILRWRRNPPAGRSSVPYRGLMRWHYFTGAIFGVTLLTWVLSGLFSMNPGKLNPSRSPSISEHETISGATMAIEKFVDPQKYLNAEVVEAELYSYGGQPFYLTLSKNGIRQLAAASTESTRLPDVRALLEDAQTLMHGFPVVRTTTLTSYDDYYYTRHPERGEKPLPALRVEFADENKTWFHIDPLAGRVMERSTSTNRLFRWLYNGLHSWDIRWLWERRPLWDIAVITFMGGGILLSMIGVVVGVRRLRY